MGSAITALIAALSGSKGMAGDDPVGAALGRAYDDAAAKVIEAMASARNGLCSIGDGVRVSAHNYALVEAMSDVTGRAAALPMPQVTCPLVAGAVPSAVGAGTSAPAGWGWVEPYIGMIWPTGDSAKLRAAAGAWTTAWVNFVATEITAGGPAMVAVGNQRIPEGDAIIKALAQASKATTDVARQCQTIATQLNSYADHIDHVHASIVDLLSRICDPMTGVKEVWDLLTDEDEDEIKRIADDIKTVVDNFAHEAETLAGEIRAAMAAAAAAAKDMAHWADKEWDHFLHATPVGKALNQVGQTFEGLGEQGWGFVKGLWAVSPNRLLTDPVRYGKDLGDTAQGFGSLVGLGPDGGPGVRQSWKALGKDVTHWDEWSTNPAKALGRTIFDAGTLALPGGPLSKLGKLGHSTADALKGLKKPPEIPKLPSEKPPAEPPPAQSKPAEPPEPGRPAPPPSDKPAPSGKPTPAPADGPLPHSPTESKPPPAAKPPSVEAPKPTATPGEPAGRPPASPPHLPGEHLPPSHPASAEAAPPESPRAPGAHPTEAAPPAPRAPHPPPASTPPSVPGDLPGEAPPPPGEPPTAPTSGHSAEAPPPGGGAPHGGQPVGRPPDLPAPHEGGHPAGDGRGHPHAPGEGSTAHQGDSREPHDSHPGDDGGTPGDHPAGNADGDGEPQHPKARDVFPEAREFGELTESEYRALFEDENGELRYPDEDDPAKPYAIPGTVRELTPAEIKSLHGQWVDRIGHPEGKWLAFEGTPYEGRALPHTSLDKDYYRFKIDASVGLPPGWKIEFSLAAPWFGHPGGEPQLLIIAPEGDRASVRALIDRFFLNEP